MKKIFLASFFGVIILICVNASTEKVPMGWSFISHFDQGDLYKNLKSNKITLTTFHNENNHYTDHLQFKSQEYFNALTITRKTSYAIGGLKNWQLLKIISESKIGTSLILTFSGNYLRADGSEVNLFERHIFNKNTFYQCQIVINKSDSTISENDILKTFEELTNEIHL